MVATSSRPHPSRSTVAFVFVVGVAIPPLDGGPRRLLLLLPRWKPPGGEGAAAADTVWLASPSPHARSLVWSSPSPLSDNYRRRLVGCSFPPQQEIYVRIEGKDSSERGREGGRPHWIGAAD